MNKLQRDYQLLREAKDSWKTDTKLQKIVDKIRVLTSNTHLMAHLLEEKEKW